VEDPSGSMKEGRAIMRRITEQRGEKPLSRMAVGEVGTVPGDTNIGDVTGYALRERLGGARGAAPGIVPIIHSLRDVRKRTEPRWIRNIIAITPDGAGERSHRGKGS
jgi:hypothetical protein